MINKIIVNELVIDELLGRSVREILPNKEDFKKLLMSGKQLRFYIGTDATGTSLHLGHSTNYLILEKFRKLGHEVIFLVGDFTSRIGDPTDRGAARVQLSRVQVIENVKTWLEQIRPIVGLDDTNNPVRILYNHDWLSKLTFEDIINLASHFTVQHMIQRDMFEKRLAENKPVYLHEFFYPLMQGYDSVAMDVDVEMCGSDQTFNALVGRTLQKKINHKEKFVYVTTLLENPVTKEKMMSKSQGTGVFLDAAPIDMYGGVMAQPDENMHQLFIDCTLLDVTAIEEILKDLSSRDAKMRLAFEIISLYHSKDVAQKVQDEFVRRFQTKEAPTDLETIIINGEKDIVSILVESGLTKSKSEARRKIQEGAVALDGVKLSDPNFELTPEVLLRGVAVKLGKRFIKVSL